MNAILPHQPEDSEREAALADFFATVRTAAREGDAAVLAAKPALERIAQAIVGRDSGQVVARVFNPAVALRVGAMPADVSDLMMLDWSLRRDLCAVLLAFGYDDGVPYHHRVDESIRPELFGRKTTRKSGRTFLFP